MKRPAIVKRVAIGLVLFGLVAHARDAAACACCSEPGERREATSKLEAYEKDELAKIRFAKKARLFTTAAGLQNVTGITNPTDTYELTQTRAGDRWSFSFKDTNGKTGAIAFTLPAQLESFFVDPQEKTQGDPLLYKEWRLSAPIAVTGVFAPSGNATARLVLQGRGNSCTSADQLTSYMLIVKGPTAQFTLFGALAAPAP